MPLNPLALGNLAAENRFFFTDASFAGDMGRLPNEVGVS